MTDFSWLADADSILAGSTPPPEGVRVLDSSWYTPSSNTGCISIVDYLSVSIPMLSLPAFDRNELGAANRIFDRVFKDSSIYAADFEERGFLGYRYSADLFAPDADQPSGKIAFGGNSDTVFISISGTGCPYLGDLPTLAYELRTLDAHITRIDLAHDDFSGQHLDFHFLRYLSATGYWDSTNGQVARVRVIDDCGQLSGSTIYIGKKGDRELCIYEKGKQLQDSRSQWIRAEVRLWAKNRKIPLDVLTNGGAYMKGAFPGLSSFLPLQLSKCCESTRNQINATADAQAKWLNNVAGRSLRLIQDSMQPAQFDVYISNIGRSGTPRRFKGIPEKLIKTLIQQHADQELLS
jgi:phage replication initiation protein